LKLEPVPIDQALGKILVHNITRPNGRRALRKGREIDAEDVETLRELGYTNVYAADLAPDDIDENSAARRVATAVTGDGLRLSRLSTGRLNILATGLGLLRLDPERLRQLNSIPGITLATLANNAVVSDGKTAATVKIIPYAVPERSVAQAEEIAVGGLLSVDPLPARKVGVILSGSPFSKDRVVDGFTPALKNRLEALGATLDSQAFVPLEDDRGEVALAREIQAQIEAGLEMIILAGETAIMDRYDITPRAVERAGGEVACFGAPVDPGNLLMLGYMGDVPILGAPGCVRSPKANIIDLVLPRLLVGDRIGQADIVALGHGGLLEDVPERPMPRSRLT
jgi:molybdopterin biosynthesis enzyme